MLHMHRKSYCAKCWVAVAHRSQRHRNYDTFAEADSKRNGEQDHSRKHGSNERTRPMRFLQKDYASNGVKAIMPTVLNIILFKT
eukprot:4947003-Amphidinium_carterae.1